MKLFSLKRRLPHLPLDEPLPQFFSEPNLQRWHHESIKQRLLAQELEQVNQAIVNLRGQHLELRKKIERRREAGGFKHHLPAIINAPENLAFYEEELLAVQQELSDLKFAPIVGGVKVSTIPPLPPTPLTVSEKKMAGDKLKPAGTERLFFSEPNTEPKKLLDKLKYGIAELQQKWAEVQNKLQTVDYLSPEASRQLKRLDQELSQLEKISLESPFIVTQLSQQQGRIKELSPEQQTKAKQEIKGIIFKIKTIPEQIPYELLHARKHLQELDSLELPKAYVSKAIPTTSGQARNLPARRIKSIHEEVKEIILSFSAIPKEYQRRLEGINNLIAEKYLPAPGRALRRLLPYHPNGIFKQEFLQQRIKLLDLRQKLRSNPPSPEKTKELKIIEKKLSSSDSFPHYQISSRLPSEFGQVRPLTESQRKKSRKEIAKKLSQYKKDKTVVKRMNKLCRKLTQQYSPKTSKFVSSLSKRPGIVTELPLSRRKEARKEIVEKLSTVNTAGKTLNQFKLIQNEILKPYLPPAGKIIRELQQYSGKVNLSTIPNQKTISNQKLQPWHQQLAKKIKGSKRFQKKSKEVKEIEQQLSKNYHPQKVKYQDLIPLRPDYVRLPSAEARKRAKQEIGQTITSIEQSLSTTELEQITEKLLETERFQLPKVKVAAGLHYQPISYSEKEKNLKKELQKIKERKKITVAVEPTPELIALNKKIDDLQKIKLEKAKITRKLPRDRDPRELRLEQEFRTTQNLLAKALKNPSLLLGKFRVKKRSAGKTKIEQNARDEVQRILARIDGALEKPLNELLQVNQDLLNLEKTPLETGKKISKAVSMPKQSTLESAKLQQEKTQVEKELREERVPVIKKTEELLAIDQKLAEL